MNSFWLCLLVALLVTSTTGAFSVSQKRSTPRSFVSTAKSARTRLFLANEEERLSQLGFDELTRGDEPEQKVRVDLIEEVDPVTITAIGFAAIAINFLIFANMGDGGISGVVARIINATS